MPFKDKKYFDQYQKDRREGRKRKGLCPACGRRKAHPGRTNCKKCLIRSRAYTRSLKMQVIEGYGGKCACCGETKWQFLSADHVKESGADERRRLGKKTVNSGSFYRKIIKEGFPSAYRLACYNCNMSLGFLGYCPHHPDIRRPVHRIKLSKRGA
jgi:hypothetical protein